MSLKHRIYGFIFNVYNKFLKDKNKISFILDDRESFKDNFTYIEEEFKRRSPNFEFNYVVKNDVSLSNISTLASSRFIFLNDNFFPLAYMDISDKTKVIQLWHGSGAFKRFGYSSIDSSNRDLVNLIRKSSEKIDMISISSKNVLPYYREAFQIDEDKIFNFGIPRNDFYFNPSLDNIRNEILLRFQEKYPEIKDKKIILYAPTFREDVRYNNIFDYFDVDKFQKELGDEYSLIIRLHPRVFDYDKDNSISNKLSKLDNTVINCTDYENEQDLLLISDMLITDYSSIMIDFGLLRKPIIFYAYDLENYLNNERGFYLDYNKDLPGPIVENMDDLVGIIKDNNYDYDRLDKFLNYEFDYLDSNSSKRIVDYLLKQ
ncbi:CDP-glycerol glycerophosphotransferase family protein [uncultured Methanobrevibacter sp.]|uniref:CDP-glycerol glycerophosphotransferase family protein n=1 Tax=uncultured Methanobrevibacter sp. TaxID=253161 RepID=UPI002588813E|nr:CDP-glycerol glycerophosphotransferase family protein [uncultured Methanobrevibacter sp.]